MEQWYADVRIVILPQEDLFSLEMKFIVWVGLERSRGVVGLTGFDWRIKDGIKNEWIAVYT